MKRPILCVALCASLISVICSCKKSILLSVPPSDQFLIQEARSWFQWQPPGGASTKGVGNPRITTPHQPDWSRAIVVHSDQGPVIILPVHYKYPIILGSKLSGANLYIMDTITHLVIYKDPTSVFRAEQVTALPDSNYNFQTASPFSGIILIDDWNGTSRYRLKFSAGSILINNPDIEPSTVAADLGTETCYEIDGYNYSPDDPDNGESWSEDAGCTPNFYLGTASSQIGLSAKTYLDIGGGGGGTRPSPAASFTVLSGHAPISDIRAYMKCFQNGSGFKYSITLAVDQPLDGSRMPIYFRPIQIGGGYSIGHTFLIFQQISSNGTVTIRSVGFYPKSSVTPIAPNGQGVLNDDEVHFSNISITFALSGQQFIDIVNAAINSSNDNYNLNTFNCTTWSLFCLGAGGININTQQGNWLLGGGDDPGDLGEDIRIMPLSTTITRNTSDDAAPTNAGSCN